MLTAVAKIENYNISILMAFMATEYGEEKSNVFHTRPKKVSFIYLG